MAAPAPDTNVHEHALRVVRALRESAMDGYRLMARTQLDPQSLVNAALSVASVVGVKGELIPDRVGEAYFFVFPNALAAADMMVKNPTFKP